MEYKPMHLLRCIGGQKRCSQNAKIITIHGKRDLVCILRIPGAQCILLYILRVLLV